MNIALPLGNELQLAGALGYGLEYNGIRVTGDEIRLWVPIVRAMLSELGVFA